MRTPTEFRGIKLEGRTLYRKAGGKAKVTGISVTRVHLRFPNGDKKRVDWDHLYKHYSVNANS